MNAAIYGSEAGFRWMQRVRPRLQSGIPYKLYGRTPEEGFDCAGLLLWSYRECGFDLPEPRETGKYGEDYFNKPRGILLIPALLPYAKRIPTHKMESGDILVFQNMNWPGHLGILDIPYFWHVLEGVGVVKEDVLKSPWIRKRLRCVHRLRCVE